MVEELVKTDVNINLGLNVSPIYEKQAIDDVQIVLFKVNYNEFQDSFNQKVCGKTCYEYVKKVCTGFKTIETQINSTDDPVFYAKALIGKEYKYTALLFTDTPLLTSSTFLGALDYARLKNINMLRLYRGFIFNTSYLFSIENLYLKEPMDYEAQDFLVCKNFKSLHEISNIMQERIYNYHFENGVKIEGHAIIDADVFIGKNTTICNSQLLNNTQIEEGVVITNSCLNNAIVGENSKINCAVIEDSILKSNVLIEPFSSIKNKSIICENVKIGCFSQINNQKIEK